MTQPLPSPHPERGLPAELRELADEFAFEGIVGRGGTAVVYRARERALDRLVAVKVIRSRYVDDDELVARIEREARLVAQLDHPNVVALHSVRRLQHGALALVMQYVHGGTLRQELQRTGPLPIARVRRILTDVGQALAAAHAQRVVHRDVKPENVHLAGTPERALLGDFGSAAPMSADNRLTIAGMTIGTPGYLAPELVDGGPATASADVYALGLLGWEMLIGREPWEGESLFEVLAFRKHGSLPPVESLRPDVPSSLAAAIGGALQHDPADRWPSMAAMLDVVESLDRTATGRPRRPAFRGAAPVLPLDEPEAPSTLGETRRMGVPTAGAAVAPPHFANEEASETAPSAPPPRRSRLRLAVAALALVGTAVAGAFVAYDRGLVPTGATLAVAERDAALSQEIPIVAPPAAEPAPPAAADSLGSVAPPVDSSLVVVPAAADSAPAAEAAPAPEPMPPAPAAEPTPPAPTPAPTPAPMPAAPIPAAPVPPPPAPRVAATPPVSRSTDARPTAPAASVGVAPATPAPVLAASPPPPAPAPSVESARPLSAARTVSLGGMHSCALTTGGAVRCWGANERGQLGPGSERLSLVAAAVEGVARFRTLALGLAHSCALTSDGAAHCWGANEDGQLGDGTRGSRAAAAPVSTSLRFTSIALGAAHSCAVASDARILCWGSNASGQLGTGRRGTAAWPMPVAGEWRARSLALGWHHGCAVTTDARTICWGANGAGQLGVEGGDRRTPEPVEGVGPVRALAAGSAHTCALTVVGEVRCWGRNRNGQIGDGSTADARAPRTVELPGAAIGLAAGGTHSCALVRGGDVYCWGQNRYGQLGDGSTSDRRAPVRVAGPSDFVSIAASGAHTCGVTGGGDVLCWGYNLDGQLGDGTRTNRARPVVVRRNAD